MNRRRFLQTAAGASLCPLAPRPAWSDPTAPLVLRAAPADISLVEGAAPTTLWTYGGGVPGQTLRVRRGDRLRVKAQNDLPQATSVHWHGIRIDNAMDGVSGLTQDPIPPGESFDYDFVVPDAGTYWYHPHFRTWEQMARGLSGPLIVEELEPPQVDRDLVLVVDDWSLTDDGAFNEETLGSLGHWSHGGRTGNWPTVNGVYRPTLPVKRGERLRLRLINTCNASIMPLGFSGFSGALVALDGQPLDAPEDLPEVITLGPGQRADVIVDVGEDDAALNYRLGDHPPYLFAAFPVSGARRAEPLGDIAPLQANPAPPALDLTTALRVDLRMEGGAMGGLREARMGRHPMTAMMGVGSPAKTPDGPISIGDMIQRGFVWSMDGVAGMPLEPLFEAKRGQTVVISMPNDTAWPHAMHVHGHHFRRVDQMTGPRRDTILVDRRASLDIAFVADNSGDWMIHCHMLEHQVAGMATWFRVL